MKYLIMVWFFLCFSIVVKAQTITGIVTKWSDEFTEWEILDHEDYVVGDLKLRWPQQRTWSEWDFRIGELTGQIKRKWHDNNNEWEIRSDNQIITARTIWRDDFREWRLSDGRTQLSIKTRYGNVADEWIIKGTYKGSFEIVSRWEGDPREWDIFDDLIEEISLPMKIGLIFVAIYNSFPKV